MERGKSSHSFFELQSEIRRMMEELAKRELDNVVQVQIAYELLNGRRTTTELVEALFGLCQGDQGYTTHYSQIDKELHVMGSRGLVSRRPFGREKPYALTQSALVKLTRVDPVKKDLSHRLFPRQDIVLYIIVLVLGLLTAWMNTNALVNETQVWVFAFIFVFIGGIAFCRFVQPTLRVIS